MVTFSIFILGGIKPFAHLLNEFILEVRYRWESGQPLPGMPKGPPDHSHCLLQQKLQMINCCIEKKVSRENKFSVSIAPKHISERSGCEEGSESEDEFFECNESGSEEEEMQSNEADQRTDPCEIPVWSRNAEGRQYKFGKLKLLNHDDWLYVPTCQDPTPLTEDMLAEQAEVTDYFSNSIPPPHTSC